MQPKIDDYESSSYYDGCFLRIDNGEFGNFGSWTKFFNGAKTGDKFGFLFNMFEGSIKIFINNVDKGFAVQKEKKLT